MSRLLILHSQLIDIEIHFYAVLLKDLAVNHSLSLFLRSKPKAFMKFFNPLLWMYAFRNLAYPVDKYLEWAYDEFQQS